jgi:hypothetical protein
LNDLLHVFDHLLSRSSLPVATEPGDPQKGCVRDVTILWTQSVCGYLRKVYIIYICVCVCVYAYVYIIIYIHWYVCVWGAGGPLLVQKLTRKLSMLRVVKHCLASYAEGPSFWKLKKHPKSQGSS